MRSSHVENHVDSAMALLISLQQLQTPETNYCAPPTLPAAPTGSAAFVPNGEQLVAGPGCMPETMPPVLSANGEQRVAEVCTLRRRLHDARQRLAGALHGLSDDNASCKQPLLTSATVSAGTGSSAGADNNASRWEVSQRSSTFQHFDASKLLYLWQAELRCLLVSLHCADQELRTARAAMHAPAAEFCNPPQSRCLNCEEMQAHLIQARLQAAQLELERDELVMSVRQQHATNRLLQDNQRMTRTPGTTKPTNRRGSPIAMPPPFHLHRTAASDTPNAG